MRAFVLLLLLAWPAAGQDRLEDLAARSKLVFRGTVVRTGAATLPEVPPDDRAVVVKVDEVLEAPTVLGALAGREITVRLLEPGSVRPGQRQIFFANGWLYGESLAVVEVGRLDAEEGLRERLAKVRQRIADRELLRRLDSAELVVVGRVREVREPTGGRKVPRSEHEPRWREAILKIRSVEKGRPESPTVTFLFASSRDVHWIHAPKAVEGQEAIWLLRREQSPGLLGRDLVVLDPLDVLPPGELDRVRRLIGNLP